MDFKKNLSGKDKSRILRQMLSLHKYTKTDDIYHTFILVLTPIFSCSVEKIASKLIPDYNKSVFEHKWDQISETHNKNKQSKTGVVCASFKFIEDDIKADELNYKNGSQQAHITYSELQYYLFRLTNKLFKDGGYNTIARNYFTSMGFRSEYKQKTSKSINPVKIAHMNFLLNKHNLITVYIQRKKTNLYAIGTNNPYYHFKGIIEKPGDLIILQDDYQNRNHKTKEESEIDKLKKQLKEKDNIIENDSILIKDYEHKYKELQDIAADSVYERQKMLEEMEELRMQIPTYANSA